MFSCLKFGMAVSFDLNILGNKYFTVLNINIYFIYILNKQKIIFDG